MTTVVASMANTGAVNWNVTKSDNGSIFTATNWSRIVIDIAKLQMMAANQLVLSGISSSETSGWKYTFLLHSLNILLDRKDTPNSLKFFPNLFYHFWSINLPVCLKLLKQIFAIAKHKPWLFDLFFLLYAVSRTVHIPKPTNWVEALNIKLSAADMGLTLTK